MTTYKITLKSGSLFLINKNTSKEKLVSASLSDGRIVIFHNGKEIAKRELCEDADGTYFIYNLERFNYSIGGDNV